jgi:hypothetical protein
MKLLGILILIGGLTCIFFSHYIAEQVLIGKEKIAQGEQSVAKGKQLFSSNPYTDMLGQQMTGSAEKKISKGKEDIARYEALASQLQVGGTLAVVVGAGLFIYSFFRKKKR